jgi:acyl-CoA thioester hydrolase
MQTPPNKKINNQQSTINNLPFSLPLSVRDYECDFQGIVNNAIYLNYLEHTRHEYAKAVGLDVVDLAKKGINIVVIRTEIDYKGSLRSGDTFVVSLNVSRLSRVRFVFEQEIYRMAGHRENSEGDTENKRDIEEKPILRARIIATAVNENGRPIIPSEVDLLFSH